jgi:hypothetical protein
MELDSKDKGSEITRADVHAAALVVLRDLYDEFASMDTSVLYAEVMLAESKEKSQRSIREKTLLHFKETAVSIENAVERGLIEQREDVPMLTDAMMQSSLSPAKAISYLRPNTKRRSYRALLPKELAGALTIREIIRQDHQAASVSKIVEACERTGIDITKAYDDGIEEYDEALLNASLKEASIGLEIHTIEDDPVDGPVPGRKFVRLPATMIGRELAGLNPIYAGEAEDESPQEEWEITEEWDYWHSFDGTSGT